MKHFCFIFRRYYRLVSHSRFLSFFQRSKYIGVALFTLLFCDCNNYPAQPQLDVKIPFEAVGVIPQADTLKPAHVTAVDTCEAPRVVQVPALQTGPHSASHKLNDTLHLTPPTIRDVDFYIPMTAYTADQGLYSAISSIKMDKRGNLWFGTAGGGVSRYDGRSFTTYTTAHGLANNTVWSIAEDKNGNLWFGTAGGGVSRYDGKSFTTFTTAQGLANNRVNCITEDKNGNLWFGTALGGVSRYDGKSFTTLTSAQGLASNTVCSIAEEKNGNLWFGTDGGGACCYDGKSFTTYTVSKGLANNNVYCIAVDKSGRIWFGTAGGVSCYNGNSFINYTTDNGLRANNVRSLIEDRNGDMWFGTYGGGVSRYDGKSFTTYTMAQGLAGNIVRGIAEDKTGNLWFGTTGGGACRYDGKSFTTYTTAQGIANNTIWSIAEDKSGNFWFGTYGSGVSRYDGKSFTTYSTAQGLAGNDIRSITEDKTGNLWFGTSGGGVSRFDGNSFTTFTTAQGLANNSVHCIAEDKRGNLWFGTHGSGLSCYDGKSFTTYTTAQGLADNSVYCITLDKNGNLWFGTGRGGVSRFDGKSFLNYTTKQGLANNGVYCITEDKHGNLWFGTDGGGVNRFDGKSFITYTTTQGLANNSVYSLAEDQAGNIWFGTNEGFSVLRSYNKALEDKLVDNNHTITPDNDRSNADIIGYYNAAFEKYSFRNGYPVKDVNTNAMRIDSKGIVWAGTGDHLVRFDYSGIRRNVTPSTVFINALKIGGEDVCWYDLMWKMQGKMDTIAVTNEEVGTIGDLLTPSRRSAMCQKYAGVRFDSITRFYPIPIDLILPFVHNNITFDFGTNELARPYLVSYQYMLEGYDKDWSPLTNRSTAAFGNMHEGSYTFKLKAKSPDGVWSEPLTYTFTVLPPIYRSWWAYLIYLLTGIYSLYSIIRWRTTKVIKEKVHLEKVVAERTAELVDVNAEIKKEKAVIERKNIEIEKQKQLSENLLLNILPEEIAAELKDNGASAARHYDDVTVLFTDFVNFTEACTSMSPQSLIDELHACFKAFDEIADKNKLEKIKTIGDAYMAVAGLPTPDTQHAQNTVKAAIEIRSFMDNRYKQIGDRTFRIRIGIHSGSVVAGIVGVKKFAYDIWGDTVNTAARMEQNSEAGKINISQTTYELVKESAICEYRGEIAAKNKGKLKMYYIP